MKAYIYFLFAVVLTSGWLSEGYAATQCELDEQKCLQQCGRRNKTCIKQCQSEYDCYSNPY